MCATTKSESLRLLPRDATRKRSAGGSEGAKDEKEPKDGGGFRSYGFQFTVPWLAYRSSIKNQYQEENVCLRWILRSRTIWGPEFETEAVRHRGRTDSGVASRMGKAAESPVFSRGAWESLGGKGETEKCISFQNPSFIALFPFCTSSLIAPRKSSTDLVPL